MENSIVDKKAGSYVHYMVGFILSIILTLLSYALVAYHAMHGWMLLVTLGVFASVQLGVQLYFFLHMGRGKNAYWNMAAFVFMLITVLIVVVGSLWIMNNLNYNMMSPDETNSHMLHESNKGF